FIKRDWQASKILKEDFKYQIFNNVLTSNTFNNKLNAEEKKSLMEKYNINENDYVVVYCGRLIKEKGIDVLIKAVKQLNIENLKLLIIGESAFKNSSPTPFVEEIKTIIGDDKRFIFTGFVDNKELYKYYSLANVQVIPSVWEEVAGIVALEGRAVGLPQIVTNSGGLTEYASKDAIVLDKSNKLQEQLEKEILKFYHKEYNFKTNSENIAGAKDYYKQFEELINE
ncbi:MAG: glycosyltransferase family 4 protein, partial [Clostridia bacterium]|nr:glycosyltransferase family 4 protein [Clostridia bacterium]